MSDVPVDDHFAAELRGFGPVGILAILVIMGGGVFGGWAVGVLVLAWAYRSHTPWSQLGFARPRSWALTAVGGVLFGAAFKLLSKSVLLPLLGVGPINHAYHFVVGNTAALPGLVLYILVSAAFGEETFYRGYLFERIGKLLGGRAPAKTMAIAFSALIFGLAHVVDQGWDGALQAVIVGLVFGVIYATTGRLWFLMFAHASFDLTAVAIIYFDLETRVAHWFFR